jgi:putative intracellular protease/amidase
MVLRYRRIAMRILSYACAIVFVPLLAGVVGLVIQLGDDRTPPPFTGALPTPPAHDPGKRTAVILAANSGAEASDFLAPYGVLARSGAFNLYAVAPERRITHLFTSGRGVDFMPHYSFAEYDAVIGGAPDLIVIPFLASDQQAEYQSILAWIRAHAGPHTILLSICAGAKNLADTGLLDGHRATTHHYVFPQIAKSNPTVQLVQGVRYVEDGNIVTSAGVTSGVDATLFVLKRMLGRAAALDVAQQIVYPHTRFLDDPTYAPPVAGKYGVFLTKSRPYNSQLGVALYPGMDEIALASVIDTYPQEADITVQTLAPAREVVLSQHGLALIPRWSFADAPRLDRIIMPGRGMSAETTAAFTQWAAARYQLPVEQVHQVPGYAYDLTFADMARRTGSALTREAVYMIEYPMQLPADAPLYPPGLVAREIALALLGLALAVLIDRWILARKQRRQSMRMRVAAA